MYRRGYPQYAGRAKDTFPLSSKTHCFGGGSHGERDSYYRDKTKNLTPNLDFYQNKAAFKPNGVKIEELLKWKNDKLERNHSYIQWLFPLREPGKNSSARPLTQDEIQMMRGDTDAMRRLLEAYKLMLQFYGIELQDSITGKVKRAKNWEERFYNLNNHSHNNLRITRILKCLGEMGYERFQAPLVRFFLEETLHNDNLPNVKMSALDYFMFTVKDQQERKGVVYFAFCAWTERNSPESFVWGPVETLLSYRNGNRARSEHRPTSGNKKYSTHHQSHPRREDSLQF
ncbi:opioid growth factor receptor-like [Dendropsophus ebraccatus]|uniref:opioid growth factor receptor-like n=1 Tax=Dendropsophus ebraccatus TaxID=150705 RepID=UPI003831786C